MTNPMFNPPPNYSGVTIQIANPAVNVGQQAERVPCVNCGTFNQNDVPNYNNYVTYPQVNMVPANNMQPQTINKPASAPNYSNGYPNAYPAQYYLNNYNYALNGNGEPNKLSNGVYDNSAAQPKYSQDDSQEAVNNSYDNNVNSYKMYAQGNVQKENDMTKSENIKEDLAQRENELAEEKKNTKETKIVALTDEYIKSLENYLNNQNDEIRLMASKEILTRLDEDKDRYDDAALNALLNKMVQDPNKLVRIAALSAFNSQLASGNDYTVKLLQNIQSNPNSDKEDVLQAADILLKMSAGVEVKNIPNPSLKENKEQ